MVLKTIVVLSYEGNVRIYGIPHHINRSTIIDVARRCLMKHFNKPLTGLANVEYLTENNWYKYSEKKFGEFGDIPMNFFEEELNWDEAKEI